MVEVIFLIYEVRFSIVGVVYEMPYEIVQLWCLCEVTVAIIISMERIEREKLSSVAWYKPFHSS